MRIVQIGKHFFDADRLVYFEVRDGSSPEELRVDVYLDGKADPVTLEGEVAALKLLKETGAARKPPPPNET